MKKFLALVIFVGGFMVPAAIPAADLKQSKFTQVVNDVETITADKTKKTVVVNDIFSMPDVLRTGAASRAELVAEDNTITRVGANTIFSFDQANRTVNLEQGSLLFHSPKGKGGGTIRTGSATASVLGTTIIVTTTANGGFKLLDLEGQAEIKFLSGLQQKLQPGQMTFILPGGNQRAPIVVFRLDEQTKGSQLVNGFDQPLPSLPKINDEITKQLGQILNGESEDTGLLVGDNATADQVQVVVDNLNQQEPVDPNLTDALQNPTVVTIANPLLSAVTPNHVFLKPFTTGNHYLDSFGRFSGFVAQNIDITTAMIDLLPYAGMLDPLGSSGGHFDFVATDTLHIVNDLTFNGLLPADSIYLFAGNQFLIDSDVTINANVMHLGLVTPHSLLLDGNIINNSGEIGINAGGDIALFTGGSINAGDFLDLRSGGNLDVSGFSTLNMLAGTFNVGGNFALINSSVMVAAGGGALNINASGDISLQTTASITTPSYLQLQAGQNLQILDSIVNMAAADLTAGDTFTLHNSSLIVGGGYLNILGVSGIDAFNAIIDPASSVSMTTLTGDISLVDTAITTDSGSGTVDISAGNGMLTLDKNATGVTIDAGGSVSLFGQNDVTVNDTTIANGAGAAGSVHIMSGSGMVSLDNAVVNSANDVSVSGADDVNMLNSSSISGSSVNIASSSESVSLDSAIVNSTGDVGVSGAADVSMLDTEVDAGPINGGLTVSSGGTLTLGDGAHLDGVLINGGGSVSLSGQNAATIDHTTIGAGGVDISSGSGAVSLGQGFINSVNDVNLNAYSSTLDVTRTFLNSQNGNVTLASRDQLTVDAQLLYTGNPSYLYDIGAGGSIFFHSDGGIDIENTGIKTFTLNSSGNEVEIYNPFSGPADPGAPKVKLDTVTIESGTAEIGNSASYSALDLNAVTVNAGFDVDLASVGQVDVVGSSFASTAGNFAINGSISGGPAGGADVNISDSDITATAGSIALKSAGKLTVDQSLSVGSRSFHAGTDVDLYGHSDVDVTLIGGGRIASSIMAGTGDLEIESSVGSVSLNGGTLHAGQVVNLSGNAGVSVIGTDVRTSDNNDVNIGSPVGAVLMTGGSVAAGNNNNVNITGAGMNVDGTTFAANIDPGLASPSITMENGNNHGVLNCFNSTFSSGYITLNSGDGILLDNSTFNGARADINVGSTSGHTATIKNTDFTAVISPNISAHTIILFNTAFAAGSTVNLKSFFGMLSPNYTPNSLSPTPAIISGLVGNGYVNFVSGVTYGGNPAENSVNPVSGPGIYISRTP